jgi:hypothetical protein
MGPAVAFESIRDLAEKTLLFLRGIPITLDTARRLRVPAISSRRKRFRGITAKDPRKESLYYSTLIASIVRLRSRHKGNRVSIRTGRVASRFVILSGWPHHALGWLALASAYCGGAIAFFMNSVQRVRPSEPAQT